jgi:hypothetical protein
MSQSGSGKLDIVLEGVELLFKQKGGSASFVFWMEWIRVVWTQLLDPLVEQSAQTSYMITWWQ